MDKSPDAFRTISEVADWLGVPTHVLRFWESRFTQVKPVKRAGGRRYYRPVDMLLLGGIKRLLHDEGLTIRGVQKMLREDGVRHVSSFSQPLDTMDPMRDVGDFDDGDAAMAVDVEPEVVDNVVPLVPAAPAPAPKAPAPEVEGAEAEGTEAEGAEAEGAEEPETADPAPLVLQDRIVPEAPIAAPPAAEPVPLGSAAQEADADPSPPDTASAEGGDRIPEFSFLRRRAHEGAQPAQPDLFAPPDVPEAADLPPAPVATAAPTGRAIPATPDVPDTDAADDDPYTPARPGMAVRLATGRLRADPAAIARVVAQLHDLRARL